MAPLMNLRAVGVILFLALALRAAAAINTKVINHDGARFTMSARAMLDGNLDYALEVEPRMPPLYPLLIALAAFFTGDLGLAGVLISVLTGTLLVLPVYLLSRDLWGERIGLVAGLVVAILPDLALVSGDVWSEPLFLLCFFSSIAAIWFAGERPSFLTHALAGAFGGLAVNTRPEGLYTLAAILGWGAIVFWIHRRKTERRAARIGGPLLATVIWIALILPYSAWIHAKYGFWSTTANRFAVKMLGKPNVDGSYTEGYRFDESVKTEFGRDQASLGKVGGHAWYVLKIYLRTFGYVFVPLVVAGYFFVRGRGAVFVTLIALGYAVPTWIGLAVGLPFDDRFALAPFVALAPVIASGLAGLRARLPQRFPRERVAAIAAIMLVVGCAVRPFTPRDHRRLTLKDAGLWIKEKYGPGRRIQTMDRRIEHYAEAWSERLPPEVDQVGSRIVVIYDPYLDRHEPGFEEKLKSRYALVHTVPKGKRGHEVRIYESH
jgi:4-amino-4-deoxy-L-arabinose transferase-like glycosyltransferase